MRPVWKGTISFGLVSIPVSLVTAEISTQIKFKLIDSKDSSRIRYERVNEDTGEEVPWDRIVKGFEYSDGNYLLLSDEDFEKVKPEATRSIDIEQFIDREELDPMFLDKPYYLQSQKGGEKPYVLLRDVLKDANKMAIARIVIRTKEHLCAIYAHGDALVLNLVRFANEVRAAEDLKFPETAKITKKEKDLALQLIESMTEPWNPEDYKNEYSEALMKWIEEKIETGEDPEPETDDEEKPDSKVVDIMDLLRQSIDSETEEKPKKRKKA